MAVDPLRFEFFELPFPNGASPLPLTDARVGTLIDDFCKNPKRYHWVGDPRDADVILITAPLDPGSGQPILDEATQDMMEITNDTQWVWVGVRRIASSDEPN